MGRHVVVLAMLAGAGLSGPPVAYGQSEPTVSAPASSSSSVFEAIAEGLSRLGTKTQEIVWPRLPPISSLERVDPSKFRFVRPEEKSFPVGSAPRVSIEHADGEIRVAAWDAAVVRVEAAITAGAEDQETAQEVAAGVRIETIHEESNLEIRTVYPNTAGMGPVTRSVDYTITVPMGAQVDCVNSFGDTIIRDVQGEIGVDAQFGLVDLGHVGGPVRARVRGDWPMRVRDVREGGLFILWGVQAEFSAVAGSLDVSSFMGSVSLYELGPGLDARIVSESGPVRIDLAQTEEPALDVEVFFGQLRCNVGIAPMQRGERTYVRRTDPEAGQRIQVLAPFSDVTIEQEELEPIETASAPPVGTQATEDISWQGGVYEGGASHVVRLAAPGDVEIVGADIEAMEAIATRRVRVSEMALAQSALDSLTLNAAEGPEGVELATGRGVEPPGVAEAGMDLVVRVPRGDTVRLEAASGSAIVRGMTGNVTAVLEEGAVHAEQCRGAVHVSTKRGDVEAIEVSGEMALETLQGNVTTRRVSGAQRILCTGGKTVVDSPRAGVQVRQLGGDVRIMPLDGVQGDYDIEAENGSISILIPDGADAQVIATAHRGMVRPAFPLAGEIGPGYARLQGVPSPEVQGMHTISLTAVEGDIVID